MKCLISGITWWPVADIVDEKVDATHVEGSDGKFFVEVCGAWNIGRTTILPREETAGLNSLFECLYSLNLIGIQAKISFKTGLPASRKKHVDPLIDTVVEWRSLIL